MKVIGFLTDARGNARVATSDNPTVTVTVSLGEESRETDCAVDGATGTTGVCEAAVPAEWFTEDAPVEFEQSGRNGFRAAAGISFSADGGVTVDNFPGAVQLLGVPTLDPDSAVAPLCEGWTADDGVACALARPAVRDAALLRQELFFR